MKKKRGTLYTVIQFSVLLLFALFLRTFVLTPVEVVGISMEPTYHESDRLWQTSLVSPKRFDIATFPSPRDGKRIVKRVVGLPGDTIRMENDQLYINDKKYDEPYLDEFKKTLTDGQPLTADFSLDNSATGPATVVPEGKYFVLGDNRRKADDSRYFGFVDEESIVGVVYFRYYPLNKIGVQ
ncbi:signal peptidase I [Enterococcus moraviensis ATCC BAA-383]|uniref:Signal peptidase I n=1 Tax=Enterococcus moraviensis ATCC BAA-383 TaxID=1158609 RepID=R2SS98_9ENTE|nr:signal peptidase I [Enterococcus moraviensis]EOH95676.1 signal peptidase I [Enterococcus moraviensis ATCC BAA-383]EOT66163.1 signal peptidase I [Enterococcus moraviensis ATCC BAA-383]OJG67772.1 signal peptidase I [Enterococcus moraviensis]